MMRTSLQNEIKPPTPPASREFNLAKPDGEAKPASDVDFLSLLKSSNSDVKKERDAKALNGGLSGAETYDEFLSSMEEQTKKQRAPKNNLDKDDFLKLFVTQLQHQDPLSPEDSTEMASKLAHFNSLEQMLNVNKTLDKMLDTQKTTRSVDMVNYIGKEVEIKGGRLKLEKNAEGAEGVFQIPRAATNSTLEVRDASGTVIFSRELGTLNEGEQVVKWDGKRKDGSRASPGIYNFSISAKSINGDDLPVTMKSRAKITGVDLQDKDGLMHSDLGKVKFDDVQAIGEEGYTKNIVPEPKVDPKAAANNAAAAGKQMPGMMPQGPGGAPTQEMIENIARENLKAAGIEPAAKPLEGAMPEAIEPDASNAQASAKAPEAPLAQPSPVVPQAPAAPQAAATNKPASEAVPSV